MPFITFEVFEGLVDYLELNECAYSFYGILRFVITLDFAIKNTTITFHKHAYYEDKWLEY